MARRQDFRRIGLLVPSSSSVQEQDFYRVLPKDITLHVARMRLSNVEADSTLRIVEEIEVESQKLADVDVDLIKKRLERDHCNTMLLVGCRTCAWDRIAMTPDNAQAIIIFLFYCLAVHASQQERRKRQGDHALDDRGDG